MIYVLYHADCRDGFGSAYAAWKKLGDEARYVACQHGRPVPELELTKETTIYVVDFSFDRNLLLEWSEKIGSLVVIDHHITAQENLQGLPFAHFDMERSAAILTWRYFHGVDSEPPAFLLHVEDMDLWLFKVEGTREVCAAIDSYQQDFQIWDEFSHESACQRLRNEGAIILRFVEQQVRYICRERMLLDIGEHKQIPAVNTGIFVSECCAKLLKDHPDAPLSAAWFQVEPQRRIFSLRSRKGETDVADLSKKYGGGGHPSASGFSISVDDISPS